MKEVKKMTSHNVKAVIILLYMHPAKKFMEKHVLSNSKERRKIRHKKI